MRLQSRELAGPPNADVIYGPGVRYRGQVYVGGQQYMTEPDERAWIESRLVYNTDRNYKGYWAMRGIPLRTTANLSIDGGVYLATAGGLIDTVKVPAGAPLAARWSSVWPEMAGGAIQWESTLRRADGGLESLLIPTENNADGGGLTLPSLAPGSYLWHVRIKSGQKPYVWPPPDYKAITGREANDLEYSWIHPTLGRVFFNPFYLVGLLPPADHPLAILFEEALAAGKVIKVPAWVGLVTAADEAGNFISEGGEYSSLRVIAGNGTPGGDENGWIGDRNVSAQATPAGPCLWHIPEPGPGATPVPLVLDPTARICGAFYEEPEENGGLWVGLMVAGRAGRTTRLLRLSPELSEGGGGLKDTSQATLWCECALSNESINTIARYPDKPLEDGGAIHALTFCSRLLLRPNAPIESRLEETHPGGRSLVVIRSQGSDGLLAYHTESDFAISVLNPWAFNFILGDGPRGQFVGPGSAHHNYENLAAWHGDAYYVEEDIEEAETKRHNESPAQIENNQQYLCKYTGGQGGGGVRLAGWKVSRFDMAALAAAGANLVVTGETSGVPGQTMYPAAFRFTGGTIQRSEEWRYWVRRIAPTLREDGAAQVAIFTGYKRNVDNAGQPVVGCYLAETTGEPAAVSFCLNEEGDGLCTTKAALFDQGYDLAELPLFLVWRSEKECWSPTNELPDTGLYLPRNVGVSAVCYHLREGDEWPYDVEIYGCIELTEIGSCWPPVTTEAPTCTNLADCYESFPPGSVIGAVELSAVEGELYKVLATGKRKTAVATDNEIRSLEHYASLYPGWLWVGVDVETPLPLTQGQPPDQGALNFLATNFTTRANLNRETPLKRPARKNVVLAYILAPGVDVVMALAPR